MPGERRYWFPAKRHGWGWGLPSAWQGWLVIVVFAILLLAGAAYILPVRGNGLFVAYCLLLCAVLLAVCWLKGEPPGWHPGDGRDR